MIFSFSRKIPRWEVWIHSAAEFLEPGRVVMSIVLSILSSFLAQLMTLGEERTQALEKTNLILACSSLWSWACSSLLCALDSLSVKWGGWAPNIPFLRSFRPVITQFVPEEFPAVLSGGPGEVGRTWLQGASSGLPGALPLQNRQRNRKGLCDQGRTTSQRTWCCHCVPKLGWSVKPFLLGSGDCDGRRLAPCDFGPITEASVSWHSELPVTQGVWTEARLNDRVSLASKEQCLKCHL